MGNALHQHGSATEKKSPNYDLLQCRTPPDIMNTLLKLSKLVSKHAVPTLNQESPCNHGSKSPDSSRPYSAIDRIPERDLRHRHLFPFTSPLPVTPFPSPVPVPAANNLRPPPIHVPAEHIPAAATHPCSDSTRPAGRHQSLFRRATSCGHLAILLRLHSDPVPAAQALRLPSPQVWPLQWR